MQSESGIEDQDCTYTKNSITFEISLLVLHRNIIAELTNVFMKAAPSFFFCIIAKKKMYSITENEKHHHPNTVLTFSLKTLKITIPN